MGCAERRASSCLSRPRKYSVFSSSGQALRISSPILRSCVYSHGEAILQSGNIAKCCNTGLWNLLLLTRTVHKLPLRSTSVVTALQTNGSLQWPKETPSSSFGGAHPGASNANTSRGSYRIRSGLRLLAPLSRVSGVSIPDRQLKQLASVCGRFSVPAVGLPRFHRACQTKAKAAPMTAQTPTIGSCPPAANPVTTAKTRPIKGRPEKPRGR